ncbi:hypothetical protein [Fibrella forsythiae]|uniref:VCBS repeat-containing protein n=1 Tax=Fibrella forsythiae TaxID=2817061 RepID=A0ABS3JGJ4_9BACT|nr:hypothetical protein [Fibrella forsythiae]MBO0949117.1 hypothetical protein [Fibrella forsythiae]
MNHQRCCQLLLTALLVSWATILVNGQGRVPLTADSVALYQRHIGQTPGVYRYERHYVGDLNNDKRPDVVLIAQRTQHQPGDAPGGLARRVILLLYQPNGQLRNAVYNDQILRCTTCGGGSLVDPFVKVVFNGNLFSFVSAYGLGERTSQVITFEFDPKRPDWWLHTITLQPFEYAAPGQPTNTRPPKVLTKNELGVVRFQDFTSKLIPKK